MSEEEEDKERGFKVEDRRRFNAEGEPRPDETEPTAAKAPERPAPTDVPPQPAGAAAGDPDDGFGAPEDLTFSSFVIGLASQAFVFLGAVADPHSGVVRKDLPQAKAMIDILSLLGEKTAGNLDEQEARMMEEMLYELRLQYVRETRSTAPTKEDKIR